MPMFWQQNHYKTLTFGNTNQHDSQWPRVAIILIMLPWRKFIVFFLMRHVVE